MATTNLSGPLVVQDTITGTEFISASGTVGASGYVGGSVVGTTQVVWARATATGGTADSTSARAAVLQANTTLKWATATATGGTADSTSARAAVLSAATTLAWAPATATGGTASASGIAVAASITSSVGEVRATGGTLGIGATRKLFSGASASWSAGVFNPGDICFNGVPAAGSAVGWICTTLGTGVGAVFMGFGTVFSGA